MRTEQEQREWEVGCYGCTEEILRNSVENSITVRIPGAGGYAMVAMSMLSDAQEELSMGIGDEARKTINCAKWVIRNYLMKEPS